MTKNIKVDSVVDSQLPNFIRDEYPLFVEFIKAYYQYLESQKIHRNLETLKDVDGTLDEFVELLKGEFAISAPNYASDRFYLPLQGYHYITKGTKESVQILFRMLLQKEVDVIYPSESILRVSDGKWTQDISIFIKVFEGDPISIVGQYVYVSAYKKSIRIYVERVEHISGSLYEVFFSRQYFGSIAVGNEINFGTLKSVIVPTTVSASIIKSGTGFKLGQIFSVKTSTGSGTVAKISKVGVGGTIQQIQFIDFGTGYLAGSYYSLSSKTPQATPYSFPLSQRIKPTGVEAGSGTVSADYTAKKTIVLGTSTGSISLGARVKLKATNTDPSGGETYVFSYNSNTKTLVLSQPITLLSGTELSFSGTYISYNNPYPGYKDKTEGFQDTGYLNEQNYFDYTPGTAYIAQTITTNNVSDQIQLTNVTGRIVTGMVVKIGGNNPPSGPTTVLNYDENTQKVTFSTTGTWVINNLLNFESLPLYTEGNYAGEVVREFYTLTVEDEIDEDAALIEIKMGAIARYPGYYYNNDSFVSGLSYIQDSNYYQDFSYVLKVNEQLDAYKNVVLSYLHPVGRKMFAEYVVDNSFEITPDILISIIRKQFPEVVTAYETMDIHVDKKPFLETLIASHPVPVLYILKTIVEGTTNQSGVAEGQRVTPSDALVKITTKLINNSTLNYGGIAEGHYVTSLSSITQKITSKRIDENSANASGVVGQHKVYPLSQITAKGIGKSLSDSQPQTDVISAKNFGKSLSDQQTIDDQLSKVLTAKRTQSDNQPITDLSYFTVGKDSLTSLITSSDTTPIKSFGKSLSEEVINNDSGTAQWNPYYSQDYFLQDYQVGRRTF